MSTYKIKCISLPRREDRRIKMKHMFGKHDFEFVDAIDGKDYKLTKFDKEFIKGNDYKKHGIHIPSLVCANYMHLNLLDECANQPWELRDVPYFIFEDDVKLEKPLPFSFEEIAAKKDLHYFWLIKEEPSIAAYVVWPDGAKIMRDYIINEVKLKKGLDWSFFDLRKTDKLVGEQVEDSYFTTVPGEDSDITTLKNYDISSNK
tara:strand:- start:410 stop:1018 length:609 start_codon:yes stop_codon:yes gene_type:complete